MPKIDHGKEAEILKRITDYRQAVRTLLEENLRQERIERHARDEVFFMGIWVPMRIIPKLQKHMARRRKVIFGEIFILICVLLFGTLGFWRFFKKLFLF